MIISKEVELVFVTFHIETFHPQRATIMKDIVTNRIKLLQRFHNKKRQYKMLDKYDDLYPRSTGVKYGFYVPDKVKKTPEFRELHQ